MCYYKIVRKYCPCLKEANCACWAHQEHRFIPSIRQCLHLSLRPLTTDRPCDFWKKRQWRPEGYVYASRYCPFSLPPGGYNTVVDVVLPEMCQQCVKSCRWSVVVGSWGWWGMIFGLCENWYMGAVLFEDGYMVAGPRTGREFGVGGLAWKELNGLSSCFELSCWRDAV